MSLVIFIMGMPLWIWVGRKLQDWLWDYCDMLERDTTAYKNCTDCEFGCNWINPCTYCECHYEH